MKYQWIGRRNDLASLSCLLFTSCYCKTCSKQTTIVTGTHDECEFASIDCDDGLISTGSATKRQIRTSSIHEGFFDCSRCKMWETIHQLNESRPKKVVVVQSFLSSFLSMIFITPCPAVPSSSRLDDDGGHFCILRSRICSSQVKLLVPSSSFF